MKYVVQVGQDFECYAVEDNLSSPFTINLNQTLSNSVREPPAAIEEVDKKINYKKIVGLAFLSLVASTAVLAIVLGVVTGDYSQLKALVSGGQQVINLALTFSK